MELIQRIGLWYLIIYLIGIECIGKVGMNNTKNKNIESNNNYYNISKNYGNNDLVVRDVFFLFSLLLFVAVVWFFWSYFFV